jgi:CelD/BcsL family acetyltransferase involved in cellulose biosynthesis
MQDKGMAMTTELLPYTVPVHFESPSIAHQLTYQVSVIRSLEAFEPLRAEWDAFLKDSGLQNLCMSHGWLNIWLSHFPPDELLLIVVQDADGAWLGLAPLQIKRSRNGLTHRLLRSVEWVGTNPSVYDWMQFAIHPKAHKKTVVDAIAATIQQARWDLLDLKFCLDHEQLVLLKAALSLGDREEIIQTNAIPYLELPATVEAYEPTRRKKTRLEVNRHKNRFAKEFGMPPQLSFQSVGESSEAILTRFFAGHIKYWADRGQKSDFQRFPQLFHFYKDMLSYSHTECQPNDPQLLFSVLTVNEHQLSYHLGFWQGNGYLSHITNYNQGFKGYSPGTIHMDELIFSALDRGGVEFEFGRGDEPYKKMWTQTKKPLWQLRVFRNPLSAALWQIDIILKKLLKKGSE